MPRDRAARDLLLSSSVGTIVEWYDFFLFASAAALVFDRAFFPRVDPMSGVLLSLMTYAVGFATRPLGGDAAAMAVPGLLAIWRAPETRGRDLASAD